MNDFRQEYPKPLVYVAHSGETAKYTKYIMRFVYERGCIPLSIFEAFDYWFQVQFHQGHKALCLHDDVSVMLRCDELWVFNESGTREEALEKGGVKQEIETWEEYQDTPVKYFTWKYIGVPKYADPGSWDMPFDDCQKTPGPK